MTSDELIEAARARRLDPAAARAVRLAAGLGLRDVATALGVSAPTVSRWERGLRRPRARDAVRWARLIQDLAGGLGR